MTKTFLISMLLSIVPISELRGGIPYAYFHSVDIIPAALLCIFCNMLVPFIAYFFLATFHKLFYRLAWYKSWFDRFVEKARMKVAPKVDRYGYFGLMVFVAIPLPVTGAWTGSLGAWVLGMERKKAIGCILLGVLIAGVIVTSILLAGVGINSIFIKRI